MCLNLAWNTYGSTCRDNATNDQAMLEAWAEALQENDAMEQPASSGNAKHTEHTSDQ